MSTGNVGKITVYAYDGSTYNKEESDIFPSTSIDGFFMKMSGDGNVIILRERPNAAFNTRTKVAIYGWDGTNYVLRDKVFDPSLNPDPSSFWGFQFATSADLSTDGSRIIVNEIKAPAENDNSETSHGRALVFQWNEGTSTYDLMKTFYGTYPLQKLGESVAISGDGNTVALAHRTMAACSQADVDALVAADECGSVASFLLYTSVASSSSQLCEYVANDCRFVRYAHRRWRGLHFHVRRNDVAVRWCRARCSSRGPRRVYECR